MTLTADTPHSDPRPTQRSAKKVAYLMSRFPKLTETFVLYEILAVERHGIDVEICPLRRERTRTMHAEAEALVARARFTPLLFSRQLVAAHAYFLRTNFRRYWLTLWQLLWANLGSRRYFVAAVVFFPKAVLLARMLQQMEVTHVHAHFSSHPAAVAFAIGRLTGISYSFTAHGSDLHCDRHMLREKTAHARFVVAISQYNRRIILAECGDQYADKVQVIHCGVDLQRFASREGPTPHERGETPLQIACVGSLHEVKGQTYLIEACRLLRERGVDVLCHIVGDGEDRARLVRQAEREGLADSVRFHGKLPQDKLRALLAGIDVLVTPSVPTRSGRREGLPVVLMEALARGLAVVASDLSGIPELVEDGETGLLAPPRDAAAVADQIERLGRDPELRQRLARAGREKVVREFDLAKNAATLVGHFREEPCG